MTPKTFKPLTALLIGASSLALAMPALAQDMVFADNADLAAAALRGERVSQTSGVTQLRLASGAMLSFVEGAEFQLRPDGSVDLFKGNVTVTGAARGDTIVRLADQGSGKITGSGSSGSFSVGTDRNGKPVATGRVLTGLASIANGREEKRFAAGQAWEVANGHPRLAMSAPAAPAPRQVPAKAPPAPAPVEPAVVPIATGGPAAAAQNGVPVVLGEALAAAGASGDIVSAGQRIEAAVANPALETFPSGDLAALVGYASRIERLYGGKPFSQAQADIIRAYLGYLANGGSQAQFLTVYAGFMVQFLDLVRSGAAPSSFSGTSLADINAFLSYQSRTAALSGLSSQNRVLVDAYLAFILQGGNADLFASRYTSLTSAYFAFLRGGGNPLAFEGATQQTLSAYIAFLNQSGLLAQLAEADRALLQAYLANGGAAFIDQYRAALDAYFAYLSSGKLPSEYGAIDPAVLRQYLETLQSSGLFAQVLGDRADFFAAYLAYLKEGGTIDGWQGLPANSATAYANALSAYVVYLQAGGVPSAYTGADLALLQQYLKALIDSGKLNTLLAGQAEFLTAYYAYLASGGSADGYAGLPVYANYVSALEAYYAYLASGGTPSGYTLLSQAQILAYLKALDDAGVFAALFSGETLAFIEEYYLYLAGGGNPDLYAGLPSGGNGGGGTDIRLTSYLGGFQSAQAGSKAIAGHAGNIQPSSGTATIDTNGALVSAGDIANVTAKVTDIAGDSSAIVGRFFDGTAKFKNTQYGFNQNNGLPYVVLAPRGAPLPATGTIDYKVLAATRPVYADGLSAPGTFDGALTIQFNSNGNLFFRTLGTIVMPESGGDVTYTFQTPNYSGGQLQEVIHDSLGNYFFGASLTGNGHGCVSGGTGCQMSLYGDFAGPKPEERLGLMYQTYGGSFSAGRIQGAVVFGKDGSFPATGGGSGGGGSGGGSTGGGVLTSYTGGFNSTAARINFITTLKLSSGSQLAGSELNFDATAYTLDSNGGLGGYTRAGNITRTFGTMVISEVAGDADVVLGRWSDGTNTGANPFTLSANQGFHYMLARALPAGFVAPTTGIVQYDLLAATKPTWIDGSGAPGTFTGSFKVNFGLTQPKVAMEAKIVMPTGGASGGAYTFDFATAGGLADITQSANTFNIYSNNSFGFLAPGDDHSGSCNPGNCYIAVNGTFAGSADKVGVTYAAVSPAGNAKNIIGAAAFAVAGAGGGSSSGAGGGSGGNTGSAMLTNATTLTMVDGGTSAFTAQEVDIGTTGAITRIKLNANSTTSYGSPGVLKESGRIGDTVAWSRWDNSSTNANLNPNSHLITGTPAVSLPASGKVNYAIIGSTAPTNFNGADGNSGTVSGSLAVQFGSQATVGFSLDVNTGARGWTIATAGGAADPTNGGLTVGSNMRFASASVGITPLNASSCVSSCNASVVGALYGTGASHVGLGYQISDFASTGAFTVNGAAVFGQVQP